MKPLDIRYSTILDDIKVSIQNSPELQTYLDEEEDEQYKAFQEKFEPSLHELYERVARENPLQLESFEKYLLDPEFEGLYLPKVLGYSVLRGEVNDLIKYSRPQNHFKDILLAIANSSNFDQVRNRAGQSIQIGFALSSDIWISNLLEKVDNKKVRSYLLSQKIDKYRHEPSRRTGLVKYRKQFESLVFNSTDFPKTKAELNLNAHSMDRFLRYRAKAGFDNSSFSSEILELVQNKELRSESKYADILMLIARDYSQDIVPQVTAAFDELRTKPGFADWFFKNMLDFLTTSTKGVSGESEKRLAACLSRSTDDKITQYYNTIDTVHGKGVVHDDSIEKVREYYYQNAGRSTENACIRETIKGYFQTFLGNLPEEDYAEYFEINKIFAQYMEIFSNQKFNQDIKQMSMKYVTKLKKKYPDKRGRDYQDFKKFVKTTFVDFGFMTEKQLKEYFKTKRKKPPVAKA